MGYVGGSRAAVTGRGTTGRRSPRLHTRDKPRGGRSGKAPLGGCPLSLVTLAADPTIEPEGGGNILSSSDTATVTNVPSVVNVPNDPATTACASAAISGEKDSEFHRDMDAVEHAHDH
ncbi:hypothetical protein Vafri_1757 [Volvox africanus]|nr:hypothetical protein Vafri_1757 [Volvox africanus]